MDHHSNYYFWHHRPDIDWPPKSVQDPCQPCPEGRLSIACTQTTLTSYQQQKLVQQWCELLPTLGGLRHLWLNSRVPQRLFDSACTVPNLESLYVKWSGIKNIERLAEANSLRMLHIGSSTSLQSIVPLTKMKKLTWLGLEAISKIISLDPLASLRGLEGLTVEGSMWTTQRVESLAPIGCLLNLRYLSITNLRSEDATLKPLFPLKRLKVFLSADWWDKSERDVIQRNNPGVIA